VKGRAITLLIAQEDAVTLQEVTLSLPPLLYQKLKARAEQSKRSVEALDVLVASVTVDQLPSNLEASLAQLTLLDDKGLWRAARTTMLPEQSERLEELHSKQQCEELSAVKGALRQAQRPEPVEGHSFTNQIGLLCEPNTHFCRASSACDGERAVPLRLAKAERIDQKIGSLCHTCIFLNVLTAATIQVVRRISKPDCGNTRITLVLAIPQSAYQ
jgi:hypothetical protein